MKDQAAGNNKRIAVNTMIIYFKMIVVTVVGLFTTRYVLLGLGVSDYGLYNVMGGLLAMLNIFSTAMHTTTRRYINVEMGKPDGNINKVFNISLILHIGFAILTLILSESIGLFYIYNYLNVAPDKLSDAVFVFEVSTLVAIIGLINIPYQAVLNAHENFKFIAAIDILQVVLKVPLVIALVKYEGNALRFFSVGMCLINLIVFIAYYLMSRLKYGLEIKFKKYKEKPLYKEILVFNGYTASGAAVSVVKSQGASMVANLFFGTVVNGALAIAYQVERYVNLLAANFATSSAPQITQSYSKGDYNRTQELAENISKYMVLIMTIMVTPVACELEFIMTVWLKVIPEGALVLCQWIMLSLFFRSFDSCTSTVLIANGRLRETTITTSIIGFSYPFLLFGLLKLGLPPTTVIILTAITDILNKMINLYILHRISKFDVKHYVKAVYPQVLTVGLLCGAFYYIHTQIVLSTLIGHLVSFIITGLYAVIICYFVGLHKNERTVINRNLSKLLKKFKH